jgi:DNA-binding MarR family transcriptional regulator
MENIEETLFYRLEKAIKAYRQFAQKQITDSSFDITIDQWLVLKTIKEDETLTQRQIAEIVFKDYASITRIIELLVKKQYLNRNPHSEDRRRFDLSITEKGDETIKSIYPIVIQNRKQALKYFSSNDIKSFESCLDCFIDNCKLP